MRKYRFLKTCIFSYKDKIWDSVFIWKNLGQPIWLFLHLLHNVSEINQLAQIYRPENTRKFHVLFAIYVCLPFSSGPDSWDIVFFNLQKQGNSFNYSAKQSETLLDFWQTQDNSKQVTQLWLRFPLVSKPEIVRFSLNLYSLNFLS